ncbi:MAG: hypothetical protein HUJ75_06670, partial [Parasporobacterium sp.]|nr:hypothetical protein [Parasporobacterium sp.]
DEALRLKAEVDFSKFLGVMVDDKELSSENYNAVSGSTIVTLKKAYMNTLAAGQHKVTLVWIDGKADTNITVKDASTPTSTTAPTGTTAPTKPGVPKTGDNSDLSLWIVLAAVAAAAIAIVVVVVVKKNKKNGEK